jgi:hypothetical protein
MYLYCVVQSTGSTDIYIYYKLYICTSTKPHMHTIFIYILYVSLHST